MTESRKTLSSFDLLHAAREAATRAAGWLREVPRPSNPAGWGVKDQRDFVTEVDRTSEEIITAVLREAFPDSRVVGGFQLRAFLLCAAVLFVDGFDVQAITYVAPTITREWGLNRGELWPALTGGLVGIMLGAIFLAPLADRFGRRRVIVYSCVAFGALTLLTLAADSLFSLAALRFLTGLGLGSALPNAIGLASEYAPHKRRALVVMFVGSGVSLGAIGAGMAATHLVEPFGWRAVFVVGGILPLLLAVLLAGWLPESIRFAAVRSISMDSRSELPHRERQSSTEFI